jgi:hypothetical protein
MTANASNIGFQIQQSRGKNANILNKSMQHCNMVQQIQKFIQSVTI